MVDVSLVTKVDRFIEILYFDIDSRMTACISHFRINAQSHD